MFERQHDEVKREWHMMSEGLPVLNRILATVTPSFVVNNVTFIAAN